MELLVIGFITGVTAVLLLNLVRKANIKRIQRRTDRFHDAVNAQVAAILDRPVFSSNIEWDLPKTNGKFVPIKHP